MTRINAGIKVELLTDQHLIAEYTEILRVGPLFHKRITKGKSFSDIPKEFTLGTGHVKFFYNKGLYVNKRWHQLYNELLERNFKPTLEFIDYWSLNLNHLYRLDYDPPESVTLLLKERIKHNLETTQKGPIRYRSQIISLEDYLKNVLEY